MLTYVTVTGFVVRPHCVSDGGNAVKAQTDAHRCVQTQAASTQYSKINRISINDDIRVSRFTASTIIERYHSITTHVICKLSPKTVECVQAFIE